MPGVHPVRGAAVVQGVHHQTQGARRRGQVSQKQTKKYIQYVCHSTIPSQGGRRRGQVSQKR
jgi:hypothetical protein